MKVGNWVYSYTKGIWQITRIDEIESIFPDNSTEITVHCKRFLNSSYKKSITSESCAPDYIKQLSKKEVEKVNDIIKSKPNWYKEFQDFQDSTSSILNLTFYASDKKQRENLKNAIGKKCSTINEGLTDTQILKILKRELEINSQSSIRNFTAQFISENSEVRNKKLLYKKLEFCDF